MVGGTTREEARGRREDETGMSPGYFLWSRRRILYAGD